MSDSISDEVKNFFSIPIEFIPCNEKIILPLYAYLKLNNRFVKLFKKDDVILKSQIEHYIKRGLTSVWSSVDFFDAWKGYMAQKIQILEAEEDWYKHTRHESSAMVVDVIKAQDFSLDEKAQVLSEIGKNLSETLFSFQDSNPEEIEKAFKRCKEITEDIIRVASMAHKMGTLYEDIQKIIDLELEHSGAVSTFSVMFALVLGYSEPKILSDISFAGIFHDVGMSKLPIELTQIPVIQLSKEQFAIYQTHVQSGLDHLKKMKIPITNNVKMMIEQHHEYLNGSGYPKHISGFEFNELSQILAIGDFLHELVIGLYDSIKHPLPEAFERMKQIIRNQNNHDSLFSPDLMVAILQGVSSGEKYAKDVEIYENKKKSLAND